MQHECHIMVREDARAQMATNLRIRVKGDWSFVIVGVFVDVNVRVAYGQRRGRGAAVRHTFN